MSGLRLFAVALVAIGVAGCGKGKDATKTAGQQRTERETFEKQREERAMQNPDQVFGKALKGQEAAAKRSADYRKKVDDDAQRKYEAEEASRAEGKTK
jgi:hypothetical protein